MTKEELEVIEQDVYNHIYKDCIIRGISPEGARKIAHSTTEDYMEEELWK